MIRKLPGSFQHEMIAVIGKPISQGAQGRVVFRLGHSRIIKGALEKARILKQLAQVAEIDFKTQIAGCMVEAGAVDKKGSAFVLAQKHVCNPEYIKYVAPCDRGRRCPPVGNGLGGTRVQFWR